VHCKDMPEFHSQPQVQAPAYVQVHSQQQFGMAPSVFHPHAQHAMNSSSSASISESGILVEPSPRRMSKLTVDTQPTGLVGQHQHQHRRHRSASMNDMSDSEVTEYDEEVPTVVGLPSPTTQMQMAGHYWYPNSPTSSNAYHHAQQGFSPVQIPSTMDASSSSSASMSMSSTAAQLHPLNTVAEYAELYYGASSGMGGSPTGSMKAPASPLPSNFFVPEAIRIRSASAMPVMQTPVMRRYDSSPEGMSIDEESASSPVPMPHQYGQHFFGQPQTYAPYAHPQGFRYPQHN